MSTNTRHTNARAKAAGNGRGAGKEKWLTPDTDELFRAILKLETLDEARNFFRDLLTEKEIIEFGQRWKAARLLARGVPYSEIGRRTWMSSATIARIQKWLKGGRGGYRAMLKRIAR
jgi:TrpR-related protein YerC/YecD